MQHTPEEQAIWNNKLHLESIWILNSCLVLLIKAWRAQSPIQSDSLHNGLETRFSLRFLIKPALLPIIWGHIWKNKFQVLHSLYKQKHNRAQLKFNSKLSNCVIEFYCYWLQSTSFSFYLVRIFQTKLYWLFHWNSYKTLKFAGSEIRGCQEWVHFWEVLHSMVSSWPEG